MEDCCSIDEIAVWDRLLYQQRELDLMKLSRQMEKMRHTEKYLADTTKAIRQQQLLSQYPNLEDNRLASARMNLYQLGGDGFTSRMQKEWAEIDSWGQGSPMDDSWGQGSPMDRWSEQGSISNCAAESNSNNADQKQEPRHKPKHCKHFLNGDCDRGKYCGFRHDYSLFCTDMQKVFLGGLPKHLTSTKLRQILSEQGYTVLNNPRINRWYTPQVCLGSIAEAKRLVEQGTIVIDGKIIRVRPFEAFTRDKKKKPPDEVRRSVFLGGLASSTTTDMIRDQLGRIGVVVVNSSAVKSGYCRKVVLETFEQAQMLLRLSCVEINGSMANVRPFANMRRSSRKKAKRKIGSIK